RRTGMTTVAPGFEAVADAFDEDTGSFAAYVDGELVVDLWGGDFQEDTVALVFSGTKGVVAICLLVLVERALLDLDAPVSRYWPGFADGVLVRHVVSHTAGLPG